MSALRKLHLPHLLAAAGIALVVASLMWRGSTDRPISVDDVERSSAFVLGPGPEGWIARVGDHYLTKERLADAVVRRVSSDLAEPGSGPTTVLRQMIQAHVVEQEADRLGVQVIDDELGARFGAPNTRVLTDEEFMLSLRRELLKQQVAGHEEHRGLLPRDERARIAQVEIVISGLRKQAVVEYGIPTAMRPEPTKLADGVIATVNGQPILYQDFGCELTLRLPTSRIEEIIQEECRAELAREWMLTIDQMETVIAVEEERWLRRREMSTQEVFRTVSYEDFVKMQYKVDIEGLRRDSYFRGFYGLVEAKRMEVTDEQVQIDYTEKKASTYGDRFLVTDVQIAFVAHDDLMGPSGGRTRTEALELADDVVNRLSSGTEFDGVALQVIEQRNRTFLSRRLRVRNVGSSRHLYGQAAALKDGEVSKPFEISNEVHIIRREAWIPAPAFEDVEDLIRHRLAFSRVHEWLEQRMSDPGLVEIRWPPVGCR